VCAFGATISFVACSSDYNRSGAPEDVGQTSAGQTSAALAPPGLCFDPKGVPLNGCALPGGRDQNNDVLHYCSAHHHDTNDDTWQPGKWLHYDEQCHYSYGGRELRTTDFKLPSNALCDPIFPISIFALWLRHSSTRC
jgi:hypothetical protein